MKGKYIIILFLCLFVGSAVAIMTDSESAKGAIDESSGDKIGNIVQNQIKKVSEKAGEAGSVAVEKIKEASASVYDAVKDKGGELIQAAVIEPSKEAVKSLVKEAISASSSVLTGEDIKDILLKNIKSDCVCQ